MKNESRTRYTKGLIRIALFECLKSRGSMKDVTVKEVCERANMNRSTFYSHFRDCYDVLEQVEAAAVRDFEDIFIKSEGLLTPAFAENIAGLLKRYDDLFGACADGSIDDAVKEKMIEVSYNLCIGRNRNRLPAGREKEAEMYFSSASATFYQLTITERGRYTPEEILTFMNRLYGDSIRQFM